MTTIEAPDAECENEYADYLGEMDTIIDDFLKVNVEEMSLDQLQALVAKIQTYAHQSQKKITRKLAKQHEMAREASLKVTVAAYNGRTVMVMSLAAGGCSLLAGAAQLRPEGMFHGIGKVNQMASAASGGYIQKVFETAHLDAGSAEGLSKVGQSVSQVFSGAGQATQGVQSIFDNKKNQEVTTNNSAMEAAKLNKQETDTEAGQVGGRVDAATNNIKEMVNKHYQAILAILRA